MAAAVAVPLALAGARLAAQTGVGIAAGKLLDYGLNKGIPKVLSKAKNFTSKYRRTRGVSKVIGKIEKGYHSKGGRIARRVVSTAGGLAASYLGGKAFDKAGAYAAPHIKNALSGTQTGRRIANTLKIKGVRGAKKDADWGEAKKEVAAAKPQKEPGYEYRMPKNRMEYKANKLTNAVEQSNVKKDFAPPRRPKTFDEIFKRPVTKKTKFI